MARQSKKNQQDRLHSGEAIEIRFADVLAATCPADKSQHIIWDSVVKGLGLRVSPTGKKALILASKVKTDDGFKNYKVVLQDVSNLGIESTPLDLEATRASARSIKAISNERGMTPKEINEEATAAIEKAKAEQRKKEEAQRRLEEDAAKYTLGALCQAYWQTLEKMGKPSAQEARNTLMKHVITNQAELSSTPANQIKRRDITKILEAMTKAGIGRTTTKCRSYLVAAYNMAMSAEGDINASEAMEAFNVENNPAQATSAKAVRRLSKPRDRTLDRTELKHYIQAVKELPDSLQKDCLLLSLYTGGQRLAQLVRIERADLDIHERTLTLRDPKGNRDTPRLHVLPLVDEAFDLLEKLDTKAALNNTALLFASPAKHGVTIHRDTVSETGAGVTTAMYQNGKARAPFQVMDIRRTIETMLAAHGISKDIRAQLQSHGISGVQARHYDKYEYMAEKRHALAVWMKIVDDVLSDKPATQKVTAIRTMNGE